MNKHWLFKTDPADYSFLNLLDEKEYTWSKVLNIIEKKGIRNISKETQLFFSIAGMKKELSELLKLFPIHIKRKTIDLGEIVVDIKPVKKLERPVALWELKLNPKFRGL